MVDQATRPLSPRDAPASHTRTPSSVFVRISVNLASREVKGHSAWGAGWSLRFTARGQCFCGPAQLPPRTRTAPDTTAAAAAVTVVPDSARAGRRSRWLACYLVPVQRPAPPSQSGSICA